MHLLAYSPYPVKNDLVKSSLVPRPSPIGVHSSRRLGGGGGRSIHKIYDVQHHHSEQNLNVRLMKGLSGLLVI